MNELQKCKVWNVSLKDGRILKVATLEQGPKKESMCSGCSAPCCKGSLKPILTGEEFISRKYKFAYTDVPEWLHEQVPSAEFLATLDVDSEKGCPYHDWNSNTCSIWPNCPASCLSYDCRDEDREEFVEFVKRRKKEWKRR